MFSTPKTLIVRPHVRRVLQLATEVSPLRKSLRLLGKSGLLPRPIWARLPVAGAFSVDLPSGSSFRYSSTVGDMSGRGLYWRGLLAFRNEGLATFYRLAGRAKHVLDIGANTGVFTLVACAATPDSVVTSFEPVPGLYRRVADVVSMNGWRQRCEVRQQAVSNRVGSAPFHVPLGEVPSSASLDPTGFRGYDGSIIQVPVTTVDTVIPPGCSVDLVKIDVEGFEHLVLEGMQRVLRESSPDIFIECLPDGPYKAVEHILSSFGYCFFHVRNEQLVRTPEIVPDPAGWNRNYLCRAASHAREAGALE